MEKRECSHAALAPPSGGAGPDPFCSTAVNSTRPRRQTSLGKVRVVGVLVCGPGPITTSGASILTQTCSDRQALY